MDMSRAHFLGNPVHLSWVPDAKGPEEDGQHTGDGSRLGLQHPRVAHESLQTSQRHEPVSTMRHLCLH